MHIWSVGVEREALPGTSVHEDSTCYFRYFSNGLDMITALRENTLGTLCILLKLRLPVVDGLGIIRLLQQEGWIDKHHFILAAAELPAQEKQQLDAWQVQVLMPGATLIPFTSPVNAAALCG